MNLVFLNSVVCYVAVLQIPKPENWRKYSTGQQTMVDFVQFSSVFTYTYLCTHAYVCVVLCNFISCIDFCNYYHNQDPGLCQQYKRTPLCYPFISHTHLHPVPWQPLISSSFLNLSFQGCYKTRIWNV